MLDFSLSTALTFFQVDLAQLKKVLNIALGEGASFVELYFQHGNYQMFGLDDNKVNKAYSSIDRGVGIRAIYKDKVGYSFSEDLSFSAMCKCAKVAAYIAKLNNSTLSENSADWQDAKTFKKHYPLIETDKTSASYIQYLQQLNSKIFAADDKIIKVGLQFMTFDNSILIVNSEGLCVSDSQPLITLSANATFAQGTQKESAHAARSFRRGSDFLDENLSDTLAKEIEQQGNFLLTAQQPQGGSWPVVLEAGGSGILLHEAIGHTFEADFNRKNVSIFSDKMGEVVANKEINIVDDGTLSQNRGSLNIDDEGAVSEKTYLVKDGVLNSYIHDKISADFYGVKATGNGRRESYRSAPLPRMRSTYMENGKYERDEIIASTKKGIYVNSFTNGQVKIGAGDFTFFVKTGYLIEDGKLTTPIKDINVIGNGPKALADIEMVGQDLLIDNGSWMCGKAGQSVVVTCGMPTVKVKELVVGGKSE